MVQLLDEEIRSREVLEWTGLHLFHYPMSSCSQKLRIYLAMKAIAWTPHMVDLSRNESYGVWFMGVNPRGMVPTLVADGAVYVESNDILAELERRFPEPVLWPSDKADEIYTALADEDALHHDLRRLSFRFVHGRAGTTKTPELLATYRDQGSTTVGGKQDTSKRLEISFYENLAECGLGDEACRVSASRFRIAFDKHEETLGSAHYLFGQTVTVIDIAWFVYAHRLVLGGYPLERLHPRVDAWYRDLLADPVWLSEVEPTPIIARHVQSVRTRNELAGVDLVAMAGF